ncbi:MAG TPA: cell surface protein SprA [Bacteroidota bacterium]|nr:cell surface protein SprA [Bacteroidota bacterium]
MKQWRLMGVITLISLTILAFVFLPDSSPATVRAYTSADFYAGAHHDFSPLDIQAHADTADSARRADSLRLLMMQGRRPGYDSLGFPIDSLIGGLDSLEKKDTTWVVYLDSTSRLEQFKYKRTDRPAADMFPRHKFSLFLNSNSPALQRDVSLDSTGQFVTVHERVNGLDIKVPTTMTLEEYINMRYKEEELNNWRTFTREYTMKQGGDELSRFISNITTIDIPVPANPLLSIFGKPIINLKISGAVDIRAAFRSQKSDQVSQIGFDVSRNEPDFNQQVQINVNGTVGDKLNILADWNTQRTFEYENQLKIKYTGYEDEIVQSVEAGNVSLQTPSLIGGGQALFGIKARMQAGPLTLTSLLSQKKGQTKELTVSGGSQENKFDVLPQAYSRSYFFVDTVYRGFWETLHRSQSPTITADLDAHRIIAIDVWVSSIAQTVTDRSILKGRAYAFLPSHPVSQPYPPDLEEDPSLSQARQDPTKFFQGYFKKLDQGKDYIFNLGNQTQSLGGYIILNQSISSNQALAVTYTIVGGNGPEIYGSALNDTTVLLKLIKPAQDFAPYIEPGWDLLLKNIYPLGGRDLKKDGFELKIYRRTEGLEPQELVQGQYLLNILGLDRFNGNNDPVPDNTFDFIPGLTVDIERAEIIFPTLRPFDETIVKYFAALSPPQTIGDSLLFSEVYDTVGNAVVNSIRNKYYLRVKSSTSVSSRYNLGFNIVEGSVQVLLNGIPMAANVDYTVDYITGEVVIRNPLALQPGSNVQVKYEQNDLFQLASKTLIGARGEIDLFPNTKLGFTVMNLNQATLSDKVRLGEEPTNNMMMGVDGSTGFDLPFLTRALDLLPFYRTKELSTIRFGGEAAYSLPDPNSKKSPIASDNNASIAYLDDFEGSRRTITLDVTASNWRFAAPPGYSRLGFIDDSIKTYSKARLWYYNNVPQSGFVGHDVPPTEIWPNRSVSRGTGAVPLLFLDYNPNHRGMYNFSPNLDQSLHRVNIGGTTGQFNDPVARESNWNGVMRYIQPIAGNILEQNVSYLEIWLKAESGDLADLRRGRLYVDLGRVNEDVIPNKVLNSEDLVRFTDNPSGIPRGIVTPGVPPNGNDAGLDMMGDDEERSQYAGFLAVNAGDPDLPLDNLGRVADPSGDDWAYKRETPDFSRFNGSEGNYDATNGRFPNTEDLVNTGNLISDNQYAEYVIPLDSLYEATTFDDSTNGIFHNDLIVGGSNGWHQIRIPLLNAKRIVGPAGLSVQNVLSNVQFIRLGVSGFAEPLKIRIAEMDLVGNQWVQYNSDSTMKVSVVNIEDNPDYSSPPGVIRERDRTQPDQVILANEQSLSLILDGLQLGESRETYKSYQIRPLDLFNYRVMKMFVHGDPAFSYAGPTNYDAEVYLRFGADTNNFYEYRQPVRAGWDEMAVIFSQLTAIKGLRDSINVVFHYFPDSANSSISYGIKGNPSLRQIRYVGIGITNPRLSGKSPTAAPLRGQVWVNELRLIDVDNSPGYAYRFDTQVKLADLGAFSFNYNRTDPNFHGIEARFGDQTTRTNWALATNMELNKFLPPDWQAGTAISVGYTHSENLTKPKYVPNTDIVVTEASGLAAAQAIDRGLDPAAAADKVVTESQTMIVQDSYSLTNFRIVPPTQAWYIRDTFSKLAFSFNYTNARAHDPGIATRSNWGWNARASYAISIQNNYYIMPFKSIFNGIFLLDEFKDWKFYYIPFTGLSANLGATRNRNFEVSRVPGSAPRDTRGFSVSKQIGFGWKLTEGGLTGIAGDYGLSTDRSLIALDNDTVGGRGFGSLLNSVLFGGRDSRYSQRVTINSKPKIINIFDLAKYMDLTLGYGVTYGWQNTFQNGDLGKSSGFDNNIAANLNLRLRAMTEGWFKTDDAPAKPAAPDRRGNEGAKNDTTKNQDKSGSDGGTSSKNILNTIKNVGRVLIKIPFLDYDQINIGFAQTNRVGNSGVLGATGFQNFWGRLPWQGSLTENGPSRLYQLGFITDPSGRLRWSPTSGFPFIGWTTERGLRAPNALLTDQFNQANSITLKTTRPLWQGAILDINWKVGWQYNKTTNITTDSLGHPTPGIIVTGGSVERSYLSLPPVLFLKVFKSTLEDVGKKYDRLITEGVPANAALAQSFEQGLEALPFLSKVFGQYVPRPNWSLRWDGIEKIGGLNSVVDRLSFENAYTSSFRRDFRGDVTYGEQTDLERVTYGFAPLASINATFKELLSGNMSGNFRMNSTTSYDLNLQAQNIVETNAMEMSLSMTYSRHGFKLPLFGLNLNNDVDVTFTFSRTKNTRKQHDPRLLSSFQEGTPLDGNTRTTMEPRLKYVLSSNVYASIFYQYSRIAPDEGGSTTFGTTTNAAGLDIHIAIR